MLEINKDRDIVKNLESELPEKIIGVITCDNVRCITVDERYVPQVFNLLDKENGIYTCEYCNHRMKLI